MAAGAKPSPRGEAKGCAGVKVDISRQKAIIPAKVFLKFPTRFSPFIGLIHTIFAIFRRKVRPPHRRRCYTISFLYNKKQQHISIIYIK